MTRPVRPVAIEIAGPAGPLEALLEEPESANADAFAIVCHPHPLHQGTMNNKVVHTVVRAVNLIDRPAVRFNFRGVGKSAGRYDNGDGETEDLLAVIDWGMQRWPRAQLWLAGFSFGSHVALRAAQVVEPDRLILVAPPVTRFSVAEPLSPHCPWLVIQGENDELVDFRAVANWTRQLSPQPTLRLVPDTDHFFHGRLRPLKETVMKFLGNL
jgi:alpha/beta superfamily hydrolase